MTGWRRSTDLFTLLLMLVMTAVVVQSNWTMRSAADKAQEVVEEDKMFEAEWKWRPEGSQFCITIRVSDTDEREFQRKLEWALKTYPPNCE